MPEQETFTIRLLEDERDEPAIDAEILVQVLSGLQKTTHLIGMQQAGNEIEQRARVPAEVRKAFNLRCSLPVKGSYAVPVQLGDVGSNLFAPETIGSVASTLEHVLGALANESVDLLRQALPDAQYRIRVMEAAKSMLPKAGSAWRLALKRGCSDKEFTLDSTHRGVVADAIRQRQPEEISQTVTGYLHKMDFAEHRIVILHPETNRELACTYDESLEIALVENRRELVQVTGTVIYGHDGEVEKVIDVENIVPLDLSEFALHTIPRPAGKLRFKTPLVLTPEASGSKQLLFLERPELGIDVHAQTRDELLTEINEQVAVLWEEYAKEADESLTASALNLKHKLLAKIEEVAE